MAVDFEGVGRSVRRWRGERAEDGEVERCEQRGEARVVVVRFSPSLSVTLPLTEFEELIENGSWEYLDELL